MELKDFINKAIKQVTDGVNESRKSNTTRVGYTHSVAGSELNFDIPVKPNGELIQVVDSSADNRTVPRITFKIALEFPPNP